MDRLLRRVIPVPSTGHDGHREPHSTAGSAQPSVSVGVAPLAEFRGSRGARAGLSPRQCGDARAPGVGRVEHRAVFAARQRGSAMTRCGRGSSVVPTSLGYAEVIAVGIDDPEVACAP